MAIIGWQKPDVFQTDFSFVSVIQHNLNHVRLARVYSVKLVYCAREQAIVGLTPVDTDSSSDNQLFPTMRLQLQNLENTIKPN